MEIKQINDKTVYQIVSDLNNNVLSAFAYFEEDGRIFIAPLDINDNIDKINKKDITERYENIKSQFENENISVSSRVNNIFNLVSFSSKVAFNEIVSMRNSLKVKTLACNTDEDDPALAYVNDMNKLKESILSDMKKKPIITAIITLGGIYIVSQLPTAGKVIAVGAAILGTFNAFASSNQVNINNQDVHKKLNITNGELEEWKNFLEEAKKCQAEGSVMVNGVCKKEEEPQCLADEILVNGICKKKEPVCAQDEVLDNGKCIKSPVIKDDFTKISSTGQKLSRWGSVEWDCVLDNKTGLMWEKKTEDGKLRDYHHQYSYYYYDKDQGYFGNEDPQDYYDAAKMEINGIPVHYPYGYHCGNTLEKCNTHAFVQAVNKQKLCGYSDWRLPNHEELTNLGRKQSTRVDFFDDNDGDHWVQGESIVYLFLGDPSPYPNKAKNSVRVVRTENK